MVEQTTVDVLIDGKLVPMPAHYERPVEFLNAGGPVLQAIPGAWGLTPDDNEHFLFQRDATGKWCGFRTRF